MRQRSVQFPAVAARAGHGGGPPARRVPGQVGVARPGNPTAVRRRRCPRRHQQESRGRRRQLDDRHRGGRCRGARPHPAVERSADHAARGSAALAVAPVPPPGHGRFAAAAQTRGPDRVQPGPAHRGPAKTHQTPRSFRGPFVVVDAAAHRRRCRRRSRPAGSHVEAVVIVIICLPFVLWGDFGTRKHSFSRKIVVFFFFTVIFLHFRQTDENPNFVQETVIISFPWCQTFDNFLMYNHNFLFLFLFVCRILLLV